MDIKWEPNIRGYTAEHQGYELDLVEYFSTWDGVCYEDFVSCQVFYNSRRVSVTYHNTMAEALSKAPEVVVFCNSYILA